MRNYKRNRSVALWVAGVLFVIAACMSVSIFLGVFALGITFMLTAIMIAGD